MTECIQFAQSFTSSDLKTNCRHGEDYWGNQDKRKTLYFWWKSREFLEAELASINPMLISNKQGFKFDRVKGIVPPIILYESVNHSFKQKEL
jgi:hypothetical protein